MKVITKARTTYSRTELTAIFFFVAAFTFFLYFPGQPLMGSVSSLAFGIVSVAILRAKKPYRMRSLLVVALTLVTWTSFVAFLNGLGLVTLDIFITGHKRVPLVPAPASDYGYLSLVCPYLLPTSAGAQITVDPSSFYVKFLATSPPDMTGFVVAALAFVATAFILGKGWCGWLCPFGGIGEACRMGHRPLRAFSRLMKSVGSYASSKGIDLYSPFTLQRLRDVKYAVLVVTLLLSLVFAVQWFCVFCWAGILSWFGSPLNFAVFLGIILIFFIVLPLISSRKWCHSICPVGAGLSLMDRVTPFWISIDKRECTNCYACLSVCPTFGLAKREGGGVVVTDTCDKCLVCVYKCPTHAVELKVYNVSADATKVLVPAVSALGAFWFYWFIVVTVGVFRILVGL